MNLRSILAFKDYYQSKMTEANTNIISTGQSYLLSPFILNRKQNNYDKNDIGDVIIPNRESITSPINYVKFANGFIMNLENKSPKNTKMKMIEMINTLDYDSDNPWEQALIEWCGNLLTSYRDMQKSMNLSDNTFFRFVALDYEKKVTSIYYDETYPKECKKIENFSILEIVDFLSEYITNISSKLYKNAKKYHEAMIYILNHILWVMPYRLCKWFEDNDISSSMILDLISRNIIQSEISVEGIYFILSYFFSLKENDLLTTGMGIIKAITMMHNNVEDDRANVKAVVESLLETAIIDEVNDKEADEFMQPLRIRSLDDFSNEVKNVNLAKTEEIIKLEDKVWDFMQNNPRYVADPFDSIFFSIHNTSKWVLLTSFTVDQKTVSIFDDRELDRIIIPVKDTETNNRYVGLTIRNNEVVLDDTYE